MTNEQPPGPGWTMGDDGHWKMPDLAMGGPSTPPLPPTGPGRPPNMVGMPGPGVPSAWPPPPPASRSGISGGAVVGIIAVAALGLPFLLIVAITFLGTNAKVQQEQSPGEAAGTLPQPWDPKGSDGDSATPPAEQNAQAIARVLDGDNWHATGGRKVAAAPTTDACYPEGFGRGITSRFTTGYDHLPSGEAQDGTVDIGTAVYSSAAAAAEDLAREKSAQWAACERDDIEDARHGATSTVERLPVDPAAPGVAYAEHSQGYADTTVLIVVVGKEKAVLEFCGCTAMGVAGERKVAQAVAKVLAREQDLDPPGGVDHT
jgi:hypothetical protein